MRYLFHEELFDTEQLKMRYPKYANYILETRNEKNPNATGQTKLIVVQYKKKLNSYKLFVTHKSGVITEYPLIELQQIMQDQAENPQAQQRYAEYVQETMQASEQPIGFQDWLLNMWILPEGCTLSDPVECEEWTTWQALMYPEANLVLDPPKYVWHDFTYFNMPGFKLDDIALCFGLCYYCADMFEVSIALMTTLMIQAVKYYITKEQIAKDALVNEEKYLAEGHKIGVNPIVKAEWLRQHPTRKAVEPIDMPSFPQGLLTLNELVKEAQRTTTGVIEVVQGQQQYSGQPGIAIAQLQQASRIYFKDDVLDYQKFHQKRLTWLKDQIARFRNYPHKILGINENGEEALIDVATNALNRMYGKYCAVHATIVENWEVVKQIEQQSDMALYEMGLLPGRVILEDHNKPNPDKLLLQAKTERGEKQVIDTYSKYPVSGH
jgi:hypothetical protein